MEADATGTDRATPPGSKQPGQIKHPDLLRRAFRLLNRFMVTMWRLGLGGMLNSWPSVGGRLLILVHRGRRSGREYRAGLNYAVVDGQVYCLAGFGPSTDWYRNALAAPRVEVWLPDGWWEARAVDVSESPDRVDLLRAVLIGAGFAAWIAGFRPRHMPDEVLDEMSGDYRLLRLERVEARTGPGGPGDLAWVWPTLASALAVILGRRRRRRPVRDGSISS